MVSLAVPSLSGDNLTRTQLAKARKTSANCTWSRISTATT